MASQLEEIKNTAVQVIVQPTSFFQGMEKSGGFGPPVLFVIAMGVITALLTVVMSIVGLGMYNFGMAIVGLILIPVFMTVVAFIAAAIVFMIWKLMGSTENYETAFRCYAYVAAITPITTVLNEIPYIGALAGIAWMLYLIVIASEKVHRIERRKAWIVFGVIAAVLALISLGAQRSASRMEKELQGLGQQMGKINEMTPEEAGEAVGKFLKGLEKGSEKEQKE